jgi:hypothetical protein
MVVIVAHQPRSVPTLCRQHLACIACPSSPSIISQVFISTMVTPQHSHRPNRPSKFPSWSHHFPPTLSRRHHSIYHQHRCSAMTVTAVLPPCRPSVEPFPSPPRILSFYSPSENKSCIGTPLSCQLTSSTSIALAALPRAPL